jgi:hypothetical protein
VLKLDLFYSFNIMVYYNTKLKYILSNLCVCIYSETSLIRTSVCIPPIVARQRLGGNVTAVTNTHATIGKLLQVSFSMWPVSYQGKQAISSSQNFLFLGQNLHFCILQVNLFYDMQSKFQNKVVLPTKTPELHFITSLNIFSIALL